MIDSSIAGYGLGAFFVTIVYALFTLRRLRQNSERIERDVATRELIDWAREQQADDNPWSPRGDIDERHRFVLRDLVDAIDASRSAKS